MGCCAGRGGPSGLSGGGGRPLFTPVDGARRDRPVIRNARAARGLACARPRPTGATQPSDHVAVYSAWTNRARDNGSMELHLDDQELPVLRDLLQSALGDLSMEIANTDNAQFRARLRRERDLLKAVFDRLNAPS